ncbi:MAG: DUF4157 domain-containing protein [Bdellovibrionales bacterium]|nr:DUF4157 domain-containing protein [Bdellovibrionales bacterium]
MRRYTILLSLALLLPTSAAAQAESGEEEIQLMPNPVESSSYNPDDDKHLLGHELTHVQQQGPARGTNAAAVPGTTPPNPGDPMLTPEQIQAVQQQQLKKLGQMKTFVPEAR